MNASSNFSVERMAAGGTRLPIRALGVRPHRYLAVRRDCLSCMKSSIQIIEGRGWITRNTVGRPRARFCAFLSVIWLGVSLCASLPFWDGWPDSFGSLEWLCSALLVAQPIYVVLAIVFRLTEKPGSTVERNRNPDYDIGKLY